MANCIYKYKGKDYTKEQFYSLVSNSNFIQQEQAKKFTELQERLNNKEFLEGAKNAFESSEELQNVYYEALGFKKTTDTKSNIDRLQERLSKTVDLTTPQQFADYGYTLKSNYADEIGTVLRSFASNVISDEEFSDRLLNILEEQEFTSEERVDKMRVSELKSLALTIKYRNLILSNKENILKNILKKQSSKKFEVRKVNNREDSFIIDTDYGGAGIGFNPITNEVWENDNKSILVVNEQITTQQKQEALNAYTDYIARVSLGIVKNPSSGKYNYESQVKDIVYHGTHVKFDKFERGKRNFDGRKTNTEGFHLIAAVDKEYYREKYKGLIPAIVNFKNPVSANNGNYEAALEYLSKRDIEQFNAMGFDSGIKFINDEDGSLEYVAFEPEQAHILGSKQDIENFANFVKNNNIGNIEAMQNYMDSKSVDYIMNKLIQSGKIEKKC